MEEEKSIVQLRRDWSMIPAFIEDGLLPPGDYEVTLEELRGSMLVVGPGVAYPSWDEEWRARLVDNLAIMVKQLWGVGVTEIFVDGSFVEDKDHPNDIDGYFECDLMELASGRLQRALNLLDPHKVWTWDPRRVGRSAVIPRGSSRCGTCIGWSCIPTSGSFRGSATSSATSSSSHRPFGNPVAMAGSEVS